MDLADETLHLELEYNSLLHYVVEPILKPCDLIAILINDIVNGADGLSQLGDGVEKDFTFQHIADLIQCWGFALLPLGKYLGNINVEDFSSQSKNLFGVWLFIAQLYLALNALVDGLENLCAFLFCELGLEQIGENVEHDFELINFSLRYLH